MATRSNVPHSNPRSKSGSAATIILQFPQTKVTAARGRDGHKQADLVAFPTSRLTVSQEDLLEERMLTHAASDAIRARDKKREWIRFGLANGVDIEPGPLKAELRPRQRSKKLHAVLSVYV
jgi:hypothetical protein